MIKLAETLERPGLMRRKYNLFGLFRLFMVCVFPIHAWALLLAFRDVSWVAERTNVWDAIGVVSYGLVFALLESLMVFLILLLLDLLLPGAWEFDQRIAFLGVLFYVVSLWAIVSQLYFLLGAPLPASAVAFLSRSRHPLRFMWALAFSLVMLSMASPVILFLRSKRAIDAATGVFEKLVVLSSFYLILDLAGIVIVVIRNI